MTLEVKRRSLLKMTITTRTLTPNTSGTHHSLFSEVHDDEHNYYELSVQITIIIYSAKFQIFEDLHVADCLKTYNLHSIIFSRMPLYTTDIFAAHIF